MDTLLSEIYFNQNNILLISNGIIFFFLLILFKNIKKEISISIYDISIYKYIDT